MLVDPTMHFLQMVLHGMNQNGINNSSEEIKSSGLAANESKTMLPVQQTPPQLDRTPRVASPRPKKA